VLNWINAGLKRERWAVGRIDDWLTLLSDLEFATHIATGRLTVAAHC
jgi:hypothetical protein